MWAAVHPCRHGDGRGSTHRGSRFLSAGKQEEEGSWKARRYMEPLSSPRRGELEAPVSLAPPSSPAVQSLKTKTNELLN